MNDNQMNEKVARLIAEGNALSDKNDFFHARQCFFAARQLDPSNTQIKIAALNNNALEYRRKINRRNRLTNCASAIKIYQKVLALSPDDVHAMVSIGILLVRTNPTLSIDYLNKALGLQPNNADIWRIKGRCYRQLNDISTELECYYQAQKIKPSLMIERWIEGVIRRLIKVLKKEMGATEDNIINLLLQRSDQLMRQRRFDDARADVKQALRIDVSLEVVLRCTAQNARIDLMEEISERKKQSHSRTSSANDFWSSDRSGMKRSVGTESDKDDNARTLKK